MANENRVPGAISSVLYCASTSRSRERAGNLNKMRATRANVKALREKKKKKKKNTRYTDVEFARVSHLSRFIMAEYTQRGTQFR